LPEVWIPPREVRDRRELLRTRMALRNLRTFLKHRIHAAIDRYGLHTDQVSDLFGLKGREHLEQCRQRLPPETGRMIQTQLEALDQLDERIAASPEVKRLMTLPGVGPTLGPVIAFEVGDIARFPHAERLASYAGLVPRVISSGGHTRHGRIARNVNLYLKWAFVEAAVCAVKLKGWRYAHVRRLFARLQPNKGYGRAIVAVARHLAEAAFWVLAKVRIPSHENYCSELMKIGVPR
jgi:transposase